ncbi:MAG: beta-ketoacyl-[acyl-carrier-protein] synthase family protein [Phycisphaerales bacterium]|jgi:3-oxoacyl-[acyl-carrier-protein] synthase II|nr:beta-ketoacyl-[acyl-carrier-protein] synthase family protein [Phycisphaerales bacterium]
MNPKRVVITGMGTVNPLGHSVQDTWDALLAGKTGISKTQTFDASTFPTTFSAQVLDFDLADHVDDAEKHRHAGRHCTFAIAAAVQAWKQSGLGQYDKLDRDRLGIYLGSGEGSLDFDNFISLVVDAWNDDDTLNTPEWGRLGFERMNMYREVEQESHMVVSHLAAEFGARGPAFNVLTACAASTQALGEAVCMIRRGEADAMISGGAHSMIHPLGVMGFNRLTALSMRNDDFETASRPFDATRDGFVLGEGASILILEDYDKVVARGAEDSILAEVMGYGSSADAFRITDQDPRGDGAAASMRAALIDADMSVDQIDYISAHGTGTKQNDQVETLAMKQIFGDDTKVPVSSAKSMLGHLIAAAGATELITCIMAMQDQILPPTANLNTPDPDCTLDYIPNEPRKASVKTCMSNSMGFGGQNNTIIITG